MRAITNSGVNIAVGTPVMWYAEAEYQSRFGNIFFSSHISLLDLLRYLEQAWIATIGAELARHLLDDLVARDRTRPLPSVRNR